MGKNKVKVTGFRITDETILEKMGEIAKIHKRTRNQEVEWALDKYVKDYEAEHGSITIQKTVNMGDNHGTINM